MKTRDRVDKHDDIINPCSQFWGGSICQTEIETGVVRTGMGTVYKVDWSHKCLSPGDNPHCHPWAWPGWSPPMWKATCSSSSSTSPTYGSCTSFRRWLRRYYFTKRPQSYSLQWMRNPDSLQEVVEERVAAGDEGFTLKLPRTVARCSFYPAELVLTISLHIRSYNGEFDRLKGELRQLHAGEKELISYRTTLLLLFRQLIYLIFLLEFP